MSNTDRMQELLQIPSESKLTRENAYDHEDEYRYLDFLASLFFSEGPNAEADRLLQAIQNSFDGSNMGSPIMIDPYLIHNLAACTVTAIKYNKDEKIPWDSGLHDEIIMRMLRGYMRTIAAMIRADQVFRSRDLLNTKDIWRLKTSDMQVPDWFVDEIKKRMATESDEV